VISDLRAILEEALERIKTEIFGFSHEPPTRPEPPADTPEAPDAQGQPGDEAGDSPA
jgi:hypothetical protein